MGEQAQTEKAGRDGQRDQSGSDSHQNVTDRQIKEKTDRPNVRRNRRPSMDKDREERRSKRKEKKKIKPDRRTKQDENRRDRQPTRPVSVRVRKLPPNEAKKSNTKAAPLILPCNLHVKSDPLITRARDGRGG